LNQRNTVSPAAVHAAKSATEAIPILADDLESDPISNGFVASLAHPGRNIPGVFSDFPDLSMKCAMKEIIPALSRVRVLWDPATGSIQLDAVQAAGRLLNVKLDTTEIHAITELARAFADEQRPQAVIIL
jgi:putative ABC transport system substrate-binding protein